MREYEAGIIRTERCGHTAYIIELGCPGIAGEIVPGQFVQVRAGQGTDPFLRRTFSVSGADPETGTITLLIDVVGPGTGLLCSSRRGGILSIIGSLGTGFDREMGGDGSCVLVAGGTGAAPLLFLAGRLAAERGCEIIFLMGARTARGLEPVKMLIPAGVRLLTATDDGSEGRQGFVSELLTEILGSLHPGAIYTCGPYDMMKSVASIAENASIPCQISLEERMACGVGACLGCAVEMRDGRMLRSCVDGPVFYAGEVAL